LAGQAGFQQQLAAHLGYVPVLLEMAKVAFVREFGAALVAAPFTTDCDAFNLEPLRVEAERVAAAAAQDRTSARDFTESAKYERTKAHNEAFLASGGKKEKKAAGPTTASLAAAGLAAAANAANAANATGNGDSDAADDAEEETPEESSDGVVAGDPTESNAAESIATAGPVSSKLKALLAKKSPSSRPAAAARSPGSATSSAATSPTRKGKVMTASTILSSKERAQLDRSEGGPDAGAQVLAAAAVPTAEQRRAVGTTGGAIRDDVHVGLGAEPSPEKGVFSFFKGFGGGGTITNEALAPVLEKTRVHLIGKNVAADVAEQLVESLRQGLVGQSKGTFTGIASLVQQNLEQALTRILSPKQRVNILGDVIKCQQQQRPYVAVFCGVNGVGKSTNLAKICFWLLENKKSICIAAGDTFRAGAVEQLRTHVMRLAALYPRQPGQTHENITLYEKGYGKDAANIAQDAVKFGAIIIFGLCCCHPGLARVVGWTEETNLDDSSNPLQRVTNSTT
jgi:signal recognition particle GTPase